MAYVCICQCSVLSKKDRDFIGFHDKTNKMSMRPTKTQISLGIRPVWSESSLCAQWVAKELRTQGFFMRTAKTLIRLGGCPSWSKSSLGAHSLCWFCHVAAHFQTLWKIWADKVLVPVARSADSAPCCACRVDSLSCWKKFDRLVTCLERICKLTNTEKKIHFVFSGWKLR